MSETKLTRYVLWNMFGELECYLAAEADARISELEKACGVLGNACANLSGLVNCESWCPARTEGGACKCGNERDHEAIIKQINAHPIAAKYAKEQA